MHLIRHSGLGLKLIVFVGVALMVYTAVFLVVVLRVERDKALAAADAAAVRLSDTIQKSVEFEMLKGRRESVQDIVEAITRQKGIERVDIFNKEGRIVVSNSEKRLGSVVAKNSQTCSICHSVEPPATVIDPTLNTGRILDSGKGHRILGKVAPLYNAPKCYSAPCHVHSPEVEVLGMMDVLISLADVDRAIAGSRNRTVVFASTLFCIVAGAIGLFIHRYVHVPIRKLVIATQAVAAGDLEQNVEIHRSDEVGMLGDSFNNMVQDLRNARDATRNFQERLIQSVREATAEVETKTRELTTIYEGIPDGIALLDRDMVVVNANPGFGQIFGVDVSQLIGKKCRDAMPGRGEMCDECPVVDAMKTGQPMRKASVLRTRDGRRVTVDVQAFPLKDAQGEVVQVIKYVKDITEEVQFEDHMRDVDKMASIGQVAAGIAHSLNTPLATLSNGLYGLRENLRKMDQENTALVEETAEYLSIMSDEVHHCQKVIRDLLDCARKPDPQYEPTDVKQLLASTINSVLLGHARNATTKLYQEGDVPLVVRASSSYLKQAFLNILQNSYDAVGEQGQVTVKARRADGKAEVIIEDTGCGMPRKAQEKAFEPLFTTKCPGKGTGLGLAVARDIIEKHGGGISLESKVGVGTRVTVVLPLMDS